MNFVVKKLVNIFPIETAYAHCDIPCGIYDPHNAQMAAHTILRMMVLLKDAKAPDQNNAVRMIMVKEKHAAICEEELVTLWADYFKPEHFESNPNLQELITSAVKLTGKVRQTVEIEVANELLKKVLEISEIFYKTKNVTPVRVKSVYPTGEEIVTYK